MVKESLNAEKIMKRIREKRKEVKKYRTGKATLRFPIGKKTPALIRKLIKTGVNVNEEK